MTWDQVDFLQKKWIQRTAYILANLFTLGNITCAIVGIIFTFISPDLGIFAFWFAKLISLSGILDFADGKLAKISGSKKLAIDVDTIVDSFAFGIFPAVYLGYVVSGWDTLPGWNIVAGVVTGLVYLSSAWYRLYRFVKRDPLYTPYFDGLPSSFAGMVIACLVIFPNTQEWVVMISTFIVSGFMISKIPFPSFKGVPNKFELFWIISTALLVILFVVFPFDWMMYPAFGIAAWMIIYLIAGPGYAIKLEEKRKEEEIEKK